MIAVPVAVLLLTSAAFCAPYQGYKPDEGLGNTGEKPPPENPNANFGYDYHNLFNDWTQYGRTYNRHKDRRQLARFKKFIGPPEVYESNLIDDEGEYYKGSRKERKFVDFYSQLEALFGKFAVPRIGVYPSAVRAGH